MANVFVTKNFSWDEFRCNDGTAVPARYRANVECLAAALEQVRAIWNQPITVLSGYRTPAYNKAVGGATKSQHMLGKAADIVVAGVTPLEVYRYLDSRHDGGLGKYRTFTHFDVLRTKRARWNG
jgi:uncharacterized protein YcbK (DUF882 family)